MTHDDLDFVGLGPVYGLQVLLQLDVLHLEVALVTYPVLLGISLRQLPPALAAHITDCSSTSFAMPDRVSIDKSETNFVREFCITELAIRCVFVSFLFDPSQVM